MIGSNLIGPGTELLFRYSTIYDRILSCLPPISLTRMSSVNRAVRLATQDFASRAYNINRRLERFVKDPMSFRSLMARMGLVISGSFALQFFDRTYYPKSDLDLYLHPNRHMIEVGLYLEREGYKFVPDSMQLPNFRDNAERICAIVDSLSDLELEENTQHEVDGESSHSLRAVYVFQRKSPEGEVQVIELVIARDSPMACIFDLHSSTSTGWCILTY